MRGVPDESRTSSLELGERGGETGAAPATLLPAVGSDLEAPEGRVGRPRIASGA